MIKHEPKLDIEKVIKLYSEKDGVPIKYVCTSDLNGRTMDIFYRDTPHPEFGNKYFGLFVKRVFMPKIKDKLFITNADDIESKVFGMIESNGDYYYSRSRHEPNAVNGKFIDGGRDYVRSNCPTKSFIVKDGEFMESSIED